MTVLLSRDDQSIFLISNQSQSDTQVSDWLMTTSQSGLLDGIKKDKLF